MPLTYADAIISLFRAEPFTTKELAAKTGNPRAAKLLSELKRRGIVERTGRGRYRCLGPEERPDLRSAEWNRIREVLLHGPEPKAWTGTTAVELWTDGRYTVSPSLAAKVFEVAIPRDKEKAWRAYLSRTNLSAAPTKRVGGSVRLELVDSLNTTILRGEPVIMRAAVERMIAEHPGLYGDARELLVD